MMSWLDRDPMPDCLRGESISWANWAVLNAPTPIMLVVEDSNLIPPEKSSASLMLKAVFMSMSSLRLQVGIG